MDFLDSRTDRSQHDDLLDRQEQGSVWQSRLELTGVISFGNASVDAQDKPESKVITGKGEQVRLFISDGFKQAFRRRQRVLKRISEAEGEKPDLYK